MKTSDKRYVKARLQTIVDHATETLEALREGDYSEVCNLLEDIECEVENAQENGGLNEAAADQEEREAAEADTDRLKHYE